ncbi:uncharacterized protein LOC143430642 [Xylocopa sonorina]|uniref:uncharacterized protein LOC143430642 n=1 Tax=Xylocopa sonorina TaxID=1818115 RepID=UPI00403A98AA
MKISISIGEALMELENLKIDKGTFEKILRDSLSDDTIEILRIEHNCLSEKGLNFLSELYAVSVIYNSKENAKTECSIEMFIKTEPNHEVARELLHKQNIFTLELRYARDVLPRIEKLVHRQLGPHLFYGSLQPPVLVMENLKKKGYVLKDRQKGMPLEYCCLAIENLAKMHAGSVALHEELLLLNIHTITLLYFHVTIFIYKNGHCLFTGGKLVDLPIVHIDPELIESFKDGGIVPRDGGEDLLNLAESSLLRISKQIEQWPEEWCAPVAKKLVKLSKIIRKDLFHIHDCDPDEFLVLNHGDCWINNMMFKEDEKGQPVDLLMVDYQMTVYNSPALDLLYFLYVCPECDIKYDKEDYFLKLYLDTLKETMESIGCKARPPTIKQLKAAMYKRRIYATLTGIVFALRMVANKEDVEDIKDVVELGETKMDVFKNPFAIEMARKLFPSMDAKGYLD